MTLTEDETVAWQTMRSLSAHYHQIYKSGLNADVAPPSDHYDLVNLGDISAPVKNANGQIIRLAQDATIMTFDNMMENSSEQAEALLAASQTIFLGQDYGLDTQELTEESGTLSLEQNSADFDKTKFIASIIGSVFLLSGGIFATRSTAQVVGRARRRRKERALKK
jgi:flagellar basal body P-ring protein FlgI